MSTLSKDITLSVCVPAFNEEKTIQGAVKDLVFNLASRIKSLEIIIVNDGSTDLTWEKAQSLMEMHSQVKLINHKYNQGLGFCYRSALRVAQGDYFTWFPADHENSAQELLNCLPYLSSDCVVTSHHRGFDRRPKLRRFFSYTYVWLLNKYFRMDLKYYNGLTIIPVSILRKSILVTRGFAFSAESLIQAVKLGCKVIQLSSPLRGRASGRSKAFSFSSFWRMGRDFLLIFRKKLI